MSRASFLGRFGLSFDRFPFHCERSEGGGMNFIGTYWMEISCRLALAHVNERTNERTSDQEAKSRLGTAGFLTIRLETTGIFESKHANRKNTNINWAA